MNSRRGQATSFFLGSRTRNELSPIEKEPKASNAGSEGAQKTPHNSHRVPVITTYDLRHMELHRPRVVLRQPCYFQKIILGVKKSQIYIRRNYISFSRRTYLLFILVTRRAPSPFQTDWAHLWHQNTAGKRNPVPI